MQLRALLAKSRLKSNKSPLTRKGWQKFPKNFGLLVLASLITVLLIGQPIKAFAQLIPIPQEQIAPPVAQPPAQEIRGVWMTSNDTDVLMDNAKLQNAVNQLAQLNFNTIYPVVWNSGYVQYPNSELAKKTGIYQSYIGKGSQGQDILAELIKFAHHHRLLVIPWFEFGFMAPQTSELVLNHPNWLTQKQDGSQTSISAAGEVVWLNPFLPEVQQFMTDLVLEVISKYNVDGVQFDDHTCLPKEFGYDRYTLALYKQETGKDAPTNPEDPAWMRWRADKITAFMTQLNQAVKQRKPQAIFSVSPNPYITAYNGYLQDWTTWVEQNIVDELIVQVYRPDMPSFLEQIVRPEIQAAQQKIPTAVGVLTGLRNRPVPMPLIQSKVQAARDRGLGVTFFFYESLWEYAPESSTERKSNFKALFNSPASRITAQQ
ncbi:glycoside hydrolase family 10 protein [Phormidium sp. LEGE 05292]|uniref:glycoside hydrolase family 10 protein n=1 Tax=[Phormidium] sp. LEGE 05292 TaxID=767427 RepID=UPI00187F65C0|nr:glycoside hydrolase family 10 protein [Phormidium sp. LEGE 05292]MBE9225355.1 glycoside hydrolase family 10 protein [Phormidium sp. LEGE 05292]